MPLNKQSLVKSTRLRTTPNSFGGTFRNEIVITVLFAGLILLGTPSVSKGNSGVGPGGPVAEGVIGFPQTTQTPKRSQFQLPQNQNAFPVQKIPGSGFSNRSRNSLQPLNSAKAAAGPVSGQSSGPNTSQDVRMKYSTGHLNAVNFRDSKIGVAVGDLGLIWRTTDGGRHWKSVRSPTSSNLLCVRFLDKQTVVAAGGHSLPVKSLHKGVFIKSSDGGKTWSVTEDTFLPRVTQIQPTGSKRLMASTAGSLRNLTGVFESFDKGRSWGSFSSEVSKPSHRWTESNGYRPKKPILTRDLTEVSSSERIRKTVATAGRFWVIASGKQVLAGRDFEGEVAGFLSATGKKFPSNPILLDIQFVSPTECWAIDTAGTCWRSTNHGKLWRSFLPSIKANAHFSLTSITDSKTAVFLSIENTAKAIRYDKTNRSWQVVDLKMPVPANSIHFADADNGWAVGSLGNVATTSDGGKSWQWIHNSRKRLTTLVIAQNPEDIPLELFAKLSADQGHIVGVLSGTQQTEFYRVKDALSLQTVAAWFRDPTCFDRQQNERSRQQVFAHWIEKLNPQVVILCGKGFSSHPVALKQDPKSTFDSFAIVEACKEVTRKFRSGGKRSQSQIQIAQICPGTTGKGSFSRSGFSHTLQQSYSDFTFVSKAILTPANLDLISTENSGRSRNSSIGIRPVASAGALNLSWFAAKSGDKFWETRYVRKYPSTNIGFATTIAKKESWILFMLKQSEDSEIDRQKWLVEIRNQRQIPDHIFSKWIQELSLKCRESGKYQLATLAAIEAWNRSGHDAYCLESVLPAIETLLSEESQWKQNVERRKKYEQELAQAQKEALEDTDPEAVKRRLYQKYGINAEEIDRIPPEIHDKIMLLEDALAGDRKALEAYRKSVTVPQPSLNIASSVGQTDLGQQAKTITLDWNRPVGNEPTMSLEEIQEQLREKISAISGKGLQKEAKTVLDRPTTIRAAAAERIIRQVESSFPQVKGYPKWWLLKIACFHKLGNQEKNLFCHKKLNELLRTHGYDRNDPNCPLVHPSLSWALVQQVFHGTDEAGWKLHDLLDSTKTEKRVPSISFGKFHKGIRKLESDFALDCSYTQQTPFLDGVIDEKFWFKSAKMSNSRFGSFGLSVCNDDQFLYLAIQVPKSISQDLSKPESKNRIRQVSFEEASASNLMVKRDQSRSPDGITIQFDVDGDHLKKFQLKLDSKGGIVEKAGTDKNWNPDVFVARKEHLSNNQEMTCFEIAIRLEDLSSAKNSHPWQLSLVKNNVSANHLLGRWWLQTQDLGSMSLGLEGLGNPDQIAPTGGAQKGNLKPTNTSGVPTPDILDTDMKELGAKIDSMLKKNT